MKKAIFGTAALLMVSAMASAQGEHVDFTPHGVTLRAGLVVPIDTTLRDVSNFFGGVGIDYTLDKTFRSNETYISFDGSFKDFSSDKDSFYPIAINERIRGARKSTAVGVGDTYTFFGVGGVLSRQDSVKFFGRGGVGVELSPTTVVEVAGTLSAKNSAGESFNTVAIYLGYRFK
jgi:hypothetical protein